jgi:myo-inositol-1(or 4)-monophosphatase
MATYEFDFYETLHLVARNIEERVANVLHQRRTLSMNAFKSILDYVAQEAIKETLSSLDASVRLVSEEGDATIGGGVFVVVADPVDGTTNLSRGFHPAVTSLSVADGVHQSDVLAGIVMDLYTEDTFYAEKDRGALLNGKAIKVAQALKYRDGLISMDISKTPRLGKVKALIEHSQHIRMEGCSAMSLCNVASGSLDAHIDVRGTVRATDISAGLIILREAQGYYSINGEIFGDMPLTRSTRVELVAASSVELINEIIGLMK